MRIQAHLVVLMLLALAVSAGLASAQDKPTTPPAAPTVVSLQADTLALREQLQQAKTEVLQLKAQLITVDRRLRGCEAAADQDLQTRLKPELDALQKSQGELDQAKAVPPPPPVAAPKPAPKK